MEILDLDALDAARLERDPFDYLVVTDFVRAEVRRSLEDDFPQLAGPGNHDVEQLAYGPSFAKFLEELRSPETARRLGARFGVALEALPTNLTVRRFAQASDGNIHTDSWTKVVTVLVYFNREWPHAIGALRLTRSPDDIEDYGAEVPPLSGTLLAFRRTDRSFHGHKPFEGERRTLQMSYVQPAAGARVALQIKRLTTRTLKRLHLDPGSNVKG